MELQPAGGLLRSGGREGRRVGGGIGRDDPDAALEKKKNT